MQTSVPHRFARSNQKIQMYQNWNNFIALTEPLEYHMHNVLVSLLKPFERFEQFQTFITYHERDVWQWWHRNELSSLWLSVEKTENNQLRLDCLLATQKRLVGFVFCTVCYTLQHKYKNGQQQTIPILSRHNTAIQSTCHHRNKYTHTYKGSTW